MEKRRKKRQIHLGKAQKFLKECYDKGAVIEYEESEGKWIDLPKGLPIDFSKFDEGKARLKFNDPTYEQIMKFKEMYGNPIVTDWDLKNIPMLAFCYNKGFCGILPEPTIGNRLEWYPIAIWRYYDKKEYLPETPVEELQKIFEKKREEAENRLVSLDEYYPYLPQPDRDFFKAWLKINKPAVFAIGSQQPILVGELDELYNECIEDAKPMSLSHYCDTYFDNSQSEKVKAFFNWVIEHKEVEAKLRKDWVNLYIKFSPEYENKKLDKDYAVVETKEHNTRNKMIDSITKEMKELKDKAAIRTFVDVMDYVRWEFHNIDEKIEDLYARTEE